MKPKTYTVDITPSGLAHAARTDPDPLVRHTAAWALDELLELIATTPERKKPASWKGW